GSPPLHPLRGEGDDRAGRPHPRRAPPRVAGRELVAGRGQQGHLGPRGRRGGSLMLSRVAESLYWMSRYIERAENMTRALAVNFYARLEAQSGGELGWPGVVALTGDEALYREVFPTWSDDAVAEFILWHPENPNAVAACMARARENARSVREQISSEMWEHLNRLYFYLVRDVDRPAVMRGPHELFQKVRDGSHAFQGITAATMNH